MCIAFDANRIQPSLDSSEILPPDAKDVACREWHRLRDNLVLVRAEIKNLQAKEGVLEAQVAAWNVILSAGGQSETRESEDDQTASNETSKLLNKQESSDAVVKLLRETGEPLHYRKIYEELTAQGIEIKGKTPPNTLLARFFADPRLERVGQGTYQIKVDQEVQPDN